MAEITIKCCGDCGKEFTAKSYKKKLCPCCVEFHREEQKKAAKEKNRIEKLKKKFGGNAKIINDANQAFELGVSYGVYMAMPQKVKLKKKMERVG